MESPRKVPPKLILASTSPYRMEQLRQIGLAAEAMAPGVNESTWKTRRWPVRTLACLLAEAKAKAVASRFPEAVVIGGDQIASLDGEPFDKPMTMENATAQLRRLSGRTHELATAVAVVNGEDVRVHLEPVLMTMRNLTDREIDDYLGADKPLDCAGCYRWEERGPLLFERVQTEDPTAILGLPMLWLTKMLREMGFRCP